MDVDKFYVLIKDDGFVSGCRKFHIEDEGPPPPFPPGRWWLVGAVPVWREKQRLRLVNHELQWQYVVPLADSMTDAIARTYVDVDAVYEAAIGKREREYTPAAAAARAYLAFVGPRPESEVVSDFITGHARAKKQTNLWAAQQIVERADAFEWAVVQLRNVRFDRQADMEAATTHEELAAAVLAWKEFITWLRGVLGLPANP